MRVVFDTNIWISIFLNKQLVDLVKLVTEKNLIILTSPYLVAEIETVIKRPFFSDIVETDVSEFIQFHLKLTELCTTSPVFNEAPDVEDNFLFDLAEQCDAKWIVTGDKKLLSFKPELDVTLLSWRDFQNQFAT